LKIQRKPAVSGICCHFDFQPFCRKNAAGKGLIRIRSLWLTVHGSEKKPFFPLYPITSGCTRQKFRSGGINRLSTTLSFGR
jgi:hypothetical protein